MENEFKTYKEVIDEMEKAAQPYETAIFQDGKVNKNKKKMFKMDAPWAKSRNSTSVVHHFLSRIDLDRSQNLEYG